MKRKLQVIDADSQFTKGLDYVNQPWVPDRPIAELFDHGHFRATHALFGAYHNLFPLATHNLKAPEIDSVVADIRSWFQGSADIIAFPNDSTIHGIVNRIKEAIGGKRTLTLGLSPAFRRQRDFELRAEGQAKRVSSANPLKVLFLDDSFTSGYTEERAMAAIRDFLIRAERSRAIVRWHTYVLVDRSGRKGAERPLFRPRLKVERELAEIAGRRAYSTLGPRSSTAGECPLCAALERSSRAAAWALGARAEVQARLRDCQQVFAAEQLGVAATRLPRLPDDIGLALLFLFSRPFPAACFHITEDTLDDPSRAAAALFFLAYTWPDSCAFVSKKRFARIFQLTVGHIKTESDIASRIGLYVAALLPASIQREVFLASFRQLLEQKAYGTIGALIALLMSSIDELKHRQSEDTSEDVLRALRGVFRYTQDQFGQILDEITEGQPDLRPACAVVRCDLIAMREEPKQNSPLWSVRMLASILHEGKHPSFLLHELNAVAQPRLQQLKDGLSQCTSLMRPFLEEVAPALAKSLERDVARLEQTTTIEGVREVGNHLVKAYWRQYIEKEYVTDSDRTMSLIQKCQRNVNAMLYLRGIEADLFDIQPLDRGIARWRFFAPHWEILKDHFQNMLLNAVKHYYQDRPGDFGAHCSRLRKDESFMQGGILVTITQHIDPASSAHYTIFSDRGAVSNAENLMSWYSGLSSCRAHVQMKGGDVFHVRGTEIETTAPAVRSALHKLAPKFSNHFVTRLPLILAEK